MNEIKITSNFLEDLKYFQKKELKKLNCKIEKNKDIGIQYFNTLHKLIPVNTYKVFFPNNFIIPPIYKKVIFDIKYKLENNISVISYLSTSLLKSNFKDQMLNNFGIYHLHLGHGLKNGFRERTDDLLFIYIQKSNVYFLGIFPHYKWLLEDKLEIIIENWPDLLSMYELKGISIESYSESKNIILRKNNFCVPTKIKDKFYIINSGIASSGDSNFVVLARNNLNNKIILIEDELRKNFHLYVKKDLNTIINYMNTYNLNKLNLKMTLNPERTIIYIFDNSKKLIKFNLSLI